jgi:hypothetical protein
VDGITMPPSNPPRYRPDYRAAEMRLLARLILAGDSLCFVGTAGVGKSNLINFLREYPAFTREYFGTETDKIHFPFVDTNQWDRTPEGLGNLILDALEAEGITAPQGKDGAVIPFSQEDRAFTKVRNRLQGICQGLQHHVVFVLDDFDRALEIGPLRMLEQLNGLRSDGNKGLLSYLVFTKRLPHILGRALNLETSSKFYDLLRHNLYSLEPCVPTDERQIVEYLNVTSTTRVSNQDLARICSLAGGHAGLLKNIFRVCVEQGLPSGNDTPGQLVGYQDVRVECQRIVAGLHEQEQEVMLLMAKGRHTSANADTIAHLKKRGILLEAEPLQWFSPVFASYLRDGTSEKG